MSSVCFQQLLWCYSSSACLETQRCPTTPLLTCCRSRIESSAVPSNSSTLALWGHCGIKKYFHFPCSSFPFEMRLTVMFQNPSPQSFCIGLRKPANQTSMPLAQGCKMAAYEANCLLWPTRALIRCQYLKVRVFNIHIRHLAFLEKVRTLDPHP